MQYDRNELIKRALKIIPEEECVTMEETWLMLGISKHGLQPRTRPIGRNKRRSP